MKERPILFSGPMVRALLAGTKTQTRRVIKPQPEWRPRSDMCSEGWAWREKGQVPHLSFWPDTGAFAKAMTDHCPYGIPGDLLWVRETFCELVQDEPGYPLKAFYDASESEEICLSDGDGFQVWNKDGSQRSPWKPSIHMPRRLSRISLEINDVRVQRLQDISEEDAIAEGIVNGLDDEGWQVYGSTSHIDCSSPSLAFRDLWESINGAGSWDRNDWVWAISFKRVTP